MSGRNEAYRIESKLGQGGSGEVYKAWHDSLGKHVAIKEVMHDCPVGSKGARNEFLAMNNIRSPYVPKVFAFLEKGSRSILVMELVEGESLDKLLALRRKIDQPQVAKWYGQLASALVAIHRENVAHRDIKPSNIIATRSGEVCLVDFSAAIVGVKNETKFLSRSPGYASPEQNEAFRLMNICTGRMNPRPMCAQQMSSHPAGALPMDHGDTETDFANTGHTGCSSGSEFIAQPTMRTIDWKRSDIYSLGASIYHLLTGSRPHEHANVLAPISQFGRFDDHIAYLVDRSMRIDPSERFGSAKQLAAAMRAGAFFRPPAARY